jgi:protein-L-isoaspartate(D-aspartate) O-methyltransferase
MQSNEEMIAYLLEQGYADEKVAKAMRKVDRAIFVPNEHEKYAYADTPLPIGKDQTISAPGVVAFMSKSLDVRKGMKILEVGSGSGYQAAILAELVGSKGKVYTVERIIELVMLTRSNIARLGYKNVEFMHGDGTKGYKEKAPFDRIIVTAAAPSIPSPLLEQLVDEGKLIIPVGNAFWQDLQLVEKYGNEKKITNIMPVVFVPLRGEFGHK